MSIEGAITVLKPLYTGTDTYLEIEVLDDDDLPVDVAGYAFSWRLKESRADADSASLLTKTTAGGHISVTGTYSATRAANTQRVRVSIEDTDTDTLDAGIYRHELKRTDAGQEAVIVSEKAVVVQAVHRS
jgi:hypothetical protein